LENIKTQKAIDTNSIDRKETLKTPKSIATRGKGEKEIAVHERTWEGSTMKSVSLFMLTTLATLVVVSGLMAQTTVHIAQAPVVRMEVSAVRLNLSPRLATGS